MSDTTCWNIEHGQDAALLKSECIGCLRERITALERHKKKLIDHMIIMLSYDKDDSLRKGIEDWLEEQGG